MHAAAGVCLIEGEPHGIGVVDTLDGGDAGQVGHAANDNLGIADPTRCSPGGTNDGRSGKQSTAGGKHRPSRMRTQYRHSDSLPVQPD